MTASDILAEVERIEAAIKESRKVRLRLAKQTDEARQHLSNPKNPK